MFSFLQIKRRAQGGGIVRVLFWWTFVISLMHLCLILLYRFRRSGMEHVPRSGAVIFVANHQSNYDPAMQLQSNRPQFLIDRIMGGDGHLSNAQSMAAIKHIDSQSTLQHVVLLHLSSQCNSPKIIREMWQHHLPHLVNCLTISQQDQCSRLLSIRNNYQEVAAVNGQLF